jgi:hypothetical protein
MKNGSAEDFPVTVEVTEKMTTAEINAWRVAHSKAATEEETAKAAVMYFKSAAAQLQVFGQGTWLPEIKGVRQVAQLQRRSLIGWEPWTSKIWSSFTARRSR